MSRRPFGQVPDELAAAPKVSKGAKLFWPLLDSLARTSSHVVVTGPDLCHLARCAPATLCRWRAELVGAGWLAHQPSRGGRGTAGVWTPLRRSRVGIRGGLVAVDKWGRRRPLTGETLSLLGESDQGNSREIKRVSSGDSKDRARTEAEGEWSASSSGHREPWCRAASCDPDTRLVDVGPDDVIRNTVSGRLYPEGSRAPCPSCHPATAPAF